MVVQVNKFGSLLLEEERSVGHVECHQVLLPLINVLVVISLVSQLLHSVGSLDLELLSITEEDGRLLDSVGQTETLDVSHEVLGLASHLLLDLLSLLLSPKSHHGLVLLGGWRSGHWLVKQVGIQLLSSRVGPLLFGLGWADLLILSVHMLLQIRVELWLVEVEWFGLGQLNLRLVLLHFGGELPMQSLEVWHFLGSWWPQGILRSRPSLNLGQFLSSALISLHSGWKLGKGKTLLSIALDSSFSFGHGIVRQLLVKRNDNFPWNLFGSEWNKVGTWWWQVSGLLLLLKRLHISFVEFEWSLGGLEFGNGSSLGVNFSHLLLSLKLLELVALDVGWNGSSLVLVVHLLFLEFGLLSHHFLELNGRNRDLFLGFHASERLGNSDVELALTSLWLELVLSLQDFGSEVLEESLLLLFWFLLGDLGQHFFDHPLGRLVILLELSLLVISQAASPGEESKERVPSDMRLGLFEHTLCSKSSKVSFSP